MGKSSYMIIGAVVGAAVALTYNYFFGPAVGTTYDAGYQSRLDYALEEGKRASLAREAELRKQFEGGRGAG